MVAFVPTMKSMGAAKNEANNAAQSAPAEKTVLFKYNIKFILCHIVIPPS